MSHAKVSRCDDPNCDALGSNSVPIVKEKVKVRRSCSEPLTRMLFERKMALPQGSQQHGFRGDRFSKEDASVNAIIYVVPDDPTPVPHPTGTVERYDSTNQG